MGEERKDTWTKPVECKGWELTFIHIFIQQTSVYFLPAQVRCWGQDEEQDKVLPPGSIPFVGGYRLGTINGIYNWGVPEAGKKIKLGVVMWKRVQSRRKDDLNGTVKGLLRWALSCKNQHRKTGELYTQGHVQRPWDGPPLGMSEEVKEGQCRFGSS